MDDAGWRDLSRRLAAEVPVFIVGMARSGTTALLHTVERLPPFRPRGSQSPETKLFLRPELIAALLARKDERLRRFLLHDAEEQLRLAHSVGEIRRAMALRARAATKLDGIGGGERVRAGRWWLRGEHHVARLFFHHARRARGTRRIIEKTGAHATRMREMRIAFPRLRAIGAFRHPVDVYCSYRKRLEWSEKRRLPEREIRWLRLAPREFAARYARRYAGFSSFRARHRDQALLVRYEELTRDAPSVLRRICSFIGEPFDAAALIEDRGDRRAGRGTPKPSQALVANQNDWREWLGEEEVDVIERELAREMRALEYEPIRSADRGQKSSQAR